jgi:polyhydroxybutyrate depolymerase
MRAALSSIIDIRHALRSLAALTALLVLLAGCSATRSTEGQPRRPATSIATTADRPCNAPTGVTNIMLRGGGATHAVRIFVPRVATKTASGTLPVVINWPALGLTGTEQAAVTGYDPLAQAQGFVVAYPTGVPSKGSSQDSWQLVDSYDPERNDIAFANALIDTLIAHWCVNPARVYSTGYSNGAFFTARLVCQLANRIAAAVMVAGVYHPAGCNPSRPVPMEAYHGTADTSIPYGGGGKSVLAGSGWPGIKGFFNDVIPDEFAKFAADFKCDADPWVTRIGSDVIRHQYVGCEHGVPMSFFEIVGGGHTWPGSPLAAVLKPFGHTTDTVNATTEGWAFMKTHSLDAR